MRENPQKLIKNATADTCKTKAGYQLYPVLGEKKQRDYHQHGEKCTCVRLQPNKMPLVFQTIFCSICIHSGYLHFLTTQTETFLRPCTVFILHACTGSNEEDSGFQGRVRKLL